MLVQLHANAFSAIETNALAATLFRDAAQNNSITVQLPDSPWPISATTFFDAAETARLLGGATFATAVVPKPTLAPKPAANTTTPSIGTTVDAGAADSSSASDNTLVIIVGSSVGALILFAMCVIIVIADRRSSDDNDVLQSSMANPYYVKSSPAQAQPQFNSPMQSPMQRRVSNNELYAMTGADTEFGMMSDLLQGFGGAPDQQSNHSYLDIANSYRSKSSHFYPAESSLLHNDIGRQQFFTPQVVSPTVQSAQARRTSHYRPPSQTSGTFDPYISNAWQSPAPTYSAPRYTSPKYTSPNEATAWQAVPNEIRGWESLQQT